MTVRLLLFAAVLPLLASCGSVEKGMTLDLLIDNHTDARGGRAAIERIKSIDIELELTEPESTIYGEYVATRDGWVRIDISIDGTRLFTEASGPDGGWRMFSDGRVDDLTFEGQEALRRGVTGNLYGMHELRDLGYSLVLLGTTSRHGINYWEVEQVAPDGFSEHIFVQQDTYLVGSAIETSALHPDLNSTQETQETIYLHYKQTAGVLFPERSEIRNLASGEIMQTVIVKSRKVNVPFDQTHYERPSTIAEETDTGIPD